MFQHIFHTLNIAIYNVDILLQKGADPERARFAAACESLTFRFLFLFYGGLILPFQDFLGFLFSLGCTLCVAPTLDIHSVVLS